MPGHYTATALRAELRFDFTHAHARGTLPMELELLPEVERADLPQGYLRGSEKMYPTRKIASLTEGSSFVPTKCILLMLHCFFPGRPFYIICELRKPTHHHMCLPLHFHFGICVKSGCSAADSIP